MRRATCSSAAGMTWLAEAHGVLDRAVCAAYGWADDPSQMTDEKNLERLLELNGACA